MRRIENAFGDEDKRKIMERMGLRGWRVRRMITHGALIGRKHYEIEFEKDDKNEQND